MIDGENESLLWPLAPNLRVKSGYHYWFRLNFGAQKFKIKPIYRTGYYLCRIGLSGGDCLCLQYAVVKGSRLRSQSELEGLSCYNRFETLTSSIRIWICQFEEIKGEEDGEEAA